MVARCGAPMVRPARRCARAADGFGVLRTPGNDVGSAGHDSLFLSNLNLFVDYILYKLGDAASRENPQIGLATERTEDPAQRRLHSFEIRPGPAPNSNSGRGEKPPYERRITPMTPIRLAPLPGFIRTINCRNIWGGPTETTSRRALPCRRFQALPSRDRSAHKEAGIRFFAEPLRLLHSTWSAWVTGLSSLPSFPPAWLRRRPMLLRPDRRWVRQVPRRRTSRRPAAPAPLSPARCRAQSRG